MLSIGDTLTYTFFSSNLSPINIVMSLKKTLAVTLAAVAATLISGCASYKNPNGVPKVLDDASEANKIGWFMGLRLPDSKAPEGFDPSKETLVRDVSYSGLAHGLNKMTGGLDVGNFGLELGLSLATNLLKHEEEEYCQALTYFPAESFATKEAAHTTAREQIYSKLADAASKAGYKVKKVGGFKLFGKDYSELWLENEQMGCPNTKKVSERCYFLVSVKGSLVNDEPAEIEPYLNLPFEKGWRIPRIHVKPESPRTAGFKQDIPTILNNLAKDLPQNTWLYVPPLKLDKNYSAPYISDGTHAYFFVKP